MKILEAYEVKIWVGLRAGYGYLYHNTQDVRKICDEFVNEQGDCVTITPTEFRYVNGHEPGVIIGWIQYPRIPRTKEEINARAFKLAEMLLKKLGQYRITITTPEKSYLIENDLDGDDTIPLIKNITKE